MRYFAGFIALFVSLVSIAQLDTVSVMYYNLLNFPGSSQEQTRVDTLEDIIAYVKPDLFLVNELESLYGANLILSNAMNVNGITHYQRATYYSGPDTQNMLFYNEDKFGLIEQFQITTDLRDISEYHLYYKEPNMNASTDTVHLWAYSCHLKAGSYQSDEDRRALETSQFKSYLDNLNRSGNLILGGDFNIYSSSEVACQNILNTGNIPFYDPINQLGNWNNNSFYQEIHTQSTRASSGGFAGGASGGLDDRFDIIFATDDIMQGNQRLTYLPGSYKSIGNDGNHFNGNINSGTNTAVPQDIANALFHNSDHLPVYMEMVVQGTVGVTEYSTVVSSAFYNSLDNSLYLRMKEPVKHIDLTIFDLSGKQVCQTSHGELINILPNLNSGIYLAQVITEKGMSAVKFVVE
jgi:endonuclease/exonuclease/phosphatase family metal-dependent hydrolase